MEKILVSACLLGHPVRYDGGAKTIQGSLLDNWQDEGRLVPLCPEVSAGFATPRPPAEIDGGCDGNDVLRRNASVRESTGVDVTAPFIQGARLALETARHHNCRLALLTDGSPSCGSTFIYSGGFDGTAKAGVGVVTALLSANGIAVFSETRIAALAAAIRKYEA